MAVVPEPRRISQETLIRATLAVVTNIRRDHLEVIGPDLGTGARTLSDVIPRNGTVITAEQRLLPTLRDEAEKRHARRGDPRGGLRRNPRVVPVHHVQRKRG